MFVSCLYEVRKEKQQGQTIKKSDCAGPLVKSEFAC